MAEIKHIFKPEFIDWYFLSSNDFTIYRPELWLIKSFEYEQAEQQF